MTVVKIHEDNIFTLLIRGSLILLTILTLGGLLFGSVNFAGSVLIGGLLALTNFYWLRSILGRALQLNQKSAQQFTQLRYLLRLALLGLTMYLLIVYTRADIFGLLIGLSVLAFNIAALSIYMSTRKGG
jgi:hypothetical protein